MLLVEYMLFDKVNLFMFSVFEMMVLVGGLCVFGVNYKCLLLGVFIEVFELLINDFFVNLFDMGIIWEFLLVDDGIY